jgi:hypothetical protein
MIDNGHWQYPWEFDVNDWFGFVYRIIDTTTGQHYIGKKQFWSTTRRVVKNRKNRRVVRRESDWRRYCSSSRHVQAAIQQHGEHSFVFLIESLHKTRAALHYAEVEYQITEDVLRARLPDGTKKYYNGMIANIKFVPPPDSDEEAQHRVSICSHNRTLNGKLNAEWMDKYSAQNFSPADCNSISTSNTVIPQAPQPPHTPADTELTGTTAPKKRQRKQAPQPPHTPADTELTGTTAPTHSSKPRARRRQSPKI